MVAVSLMLGSAAVAGPTDPADRKAEVDANINRLQGSLEDTSAALTSAYTNLKSTRAHLRTAQQTLATAREAEVAADLHHQEMVARLEVAQANEARTVDQLERGRERLTETRRKVAAFAAQMYQEQGLGELSMALDAESPSDLASRLAMADTVMTVQSESVDELATIEAGLVAKEDHLSAVRDEVAAAKQRAKEALDRATAARQAAERAEAQLTSLEKEQTKRASTLHEQRAKERERLRQARAESRRLQKILEERARKARIRAAKIRAQQAAAARQRQEDLAAAKAGQPQPAPPPASGGFLSYPVNAPTSSEFGYRYHPILHYYRLHAGLDFAAGCGVPIHAAASGQVVSAVYAGGAGNQVVIDHGVHRGVSLATVYDHMSRFAVTGGHVSRGQVIGYVGTTGLSTGCHLHFETRENGTPVNPRIWL